MDAVTDDMVEPNVKSALYFGNFIQIIETFTLLEEYIIRVPNQA